MQYLPLQLPPEASLETISRLLSGWIDLNSGPFSTWTQSDFARMERMENSIHELIAALHPTRVAQTQPSSSSPFPIAASQAPGPSEEADTDEDDDNTRQTGAGTDVSEERTSITQCY